MELLGRKARCKECGCGFQMPRHARVACKHCSQVLRIRPELLGHRIVCRHCQGSFTARIDRAVTISPSGPVLDRKDACRRLLGLDPDLFTSTAASQEPMTDAPSDGPSYEMDGSEAEPRGDELAVVRASLREVGSALGAARAEVAESKAKAESIGLQLRESRDECSRLREALKQWMKHRNDLEKELERLRAELALAKSREAATVSGLAREIERLSTATIPVTALEELSPPGDHMAAPGGEPDSKEPEQPVEAVDDLRMPLVEWEPQAIRDAIRRRPS